MKLIAGAASDVGQVRSGNEDAFLVDERLQLFAVADGMGGHQAGEVASATALETVRAAVASGTAIAEAIRKANAAVVAKAQSDEALAGMGTTITAIIATPMGVHIGHVGDSRAYLFRSGELHALTIDHSYVEQLVAEGRITPDQATVHPQRSIITRALGIDAAVDVDEGDTALAIGDRIVLCSDGLTTMIRDTEIGNILAAEPDPERAANLLVDAANDAGGEDNVTAVVVDIVEGPAETPKGPVAAINPRPNRRRDATRTPQQPTRPRPERNIGRTLARIALWALPILILIGAAVGITAWYSKQGYFAQVDQGTVVVYRGVPGGVIGFQPTREYPTTITLSDLTEAQRADLAHPKRFSSRLAVDRYITRLETDIDIRKAAATSTTTASTTTTTTRA